MNKYKYLFKNIGLLTISNFGTKILSFILIPIYTSILSTADYGTYDVYSTTVSLFVPILTLNVIEAVMRFSLDSTKEKRDVFTIGLKKIVKATFVVTVLICANDFLNLIDIFTAYPVYFVLLFASSLLYDLLIQFSRGVERIGDVAVAGALNAIVLLGLNVWFLVVLRIGLDGYFIANILACFIPCGYMGLRLKVWTYYKKNYDQKVEKEMYSYSKPLIFNTLAWWINNVSDRYIVTWLCGVAANGIYSVAYKIPSVLNVFQSIFSQAWTISAVKEFNEDGSRFYTKVYRTYNCGMVIVCSCLIIIDKAIARVLFVNDFYIAWQYAPFLMISVVFGAMSGMLGGIFSAAKDSVVFAKTTLVGAAVNTILNIILVSIVGPLGAAIATEISYSLVWFARFRAANKIVKIEADFIRDIVGYTILNIQAVIWFIFQGLAVYLIQAIANIVLLLIYFEDIKAMVSPVVEKIRKEV